MLTWTSRPSETPLRGRFAFPAGLTSTAGFVLLILSWLAPNHYPPWTSFHNEAAAFAALIALCVAHLLVGSTSHWKAPAGMTALAAILLASQWKLGQIAFGGDALLSGMYVAGACWSWWLGRNMTVSAARRPEDPLVWFAAAFLVGASVSILIGCMQWLGMEPTLGIFAVDRGPDMRVFANLAQPNHLATLCGTAALLAIWLFRAARLKAWHLALLLAWCALGVAATESRSGLLGSLLAGGVLLVAGRAWAPGQGRRLLAPVVGWWALLAAWSAAWPRLSEALLLQGARTAQLTHDGARAVMWKQCLVAIGKSPWWGHGWRQTMLAQKMAAPEVPGWLATDYAHNIGLDLAIWIGVPAALLLLALAAGWLAKTLWRPASERQVFLVSAMVPFVFHSQFEFPFAYAYFLFPICWMVGQACAEQPAREGATSSQLQRRWIVVPLAAFAVIGVMVAREYFDAEDDYRVMRFELRRVGRVPAGYENPHLPLLTQLDAVLKAGRLVPARGMSRDDLELLRVTSERNGWATLDLAYVVALGLNHQMPEARRLLAQIPAVYGSKTGEQSVWMLHEFASKYPELSVLEVP
jgi:hypothetical protein